MLEDLLAKEAEATRARRLHGRLRFAATRFARRSRTSSSTTSPRSPQGVRELSSLAFAEERRNALLLGPPGVGKTHLAISLGIAATEAGYRTYFHTASDLVGGLQSAHLEGNASAEMPTFIGPSVLVVHELGYLPMD